MASSQAAVAAPAAVAQLPFAGLVRRLTAYLADMAISASIFFLLFLTMRGLRGIGLWSPLRTQSATQSHSGTRWALAPSLQWSSGTFYREASHTSRCSSPRLGKQL